MAAQSSRTLFLCGWLLGLAWLTACQKEATPPAADEEQAYILRVPPGFPAPDIPADNALTPSRIALGKRLFYDPVLSRDSSIACASCHLPQRAFADVGPVSLGVEGRLGTRNSPSLANVAYQRLLLREGGVPTLEMQVQVPIQEHNEFDFNILLIVERLLHDPQYVAQAMEAYGRAPDAFVITRAIAAFERTLLSGDSAFDRYFFQGQSTAISESAKRGYALFESQRLGCSGCHSGFLFTSQGFANNGLYLNYPDAGRQRLTGLESDRALFKIPSLRQVALTPPYMHDGSLPDLPSVLQHYATGGQPHPNRSALIKPFSLSAQEQADLLAFLESLSDQSFVNNPDFR